MINPTTDQLLQVAETLGYRICPDHRGHAGEGEFRLRVLITIYALAHAHSQNLVRVPNAQSVVDSTYHNVASEAGLLYCDDPQHTIRGGCCGLIPAPEGDTR